MQIKSTIKNSKILNYVRLIAAIVCFSLFSWIYFVGLMNAPDFGHIPNDIYAGIGFGLLSGFYVFVIPAYINKVLPFSNYSGIIVASISFVVMALLLFTVGV